MIASLVAAVVLFLAKPAIRLSFDGDHAGSPPAFLRFESTGGLSPSSWKAIPDAKAITLENVAVQTGKRGSAGQFRFALSADAKDFLDGRVAVSVRRYGPGDFCRGGLALRFRDPANFIGVLWDTDKSEVSAFQVRKGKVAPLGSARMASNEPLWRTIRVELSGPRVAVTLSGKPALDVKDASPAPGAAGLLAEGASIVAFDELSLDPR